MTDFEQDIDHCLTVLRLGGTILYPTDTIWGIGCDATSAAAVEKVIELKSRPREKSMIVLVADEKDIRRYVAAPDPAVFDFLKTSDRPTTVIYEGAIGLAENLVAADGSIAIRLVKDEFCRHLLKRFRKPVVSTSANISGDPAPRTFREILDHIRSGVDYAVHYRQDDETPSNPSALVKWNAGSEPSFIRS